MAEQEPEIALASASGSEAGTSPTGTSQVGSSSLADGSAESSKGKAAKEVDDEKIRKAEIAISLVLRIGVVVSVLTIMAGISLIFYNNHDFVNGVVSYHYVASSKFYFPTTFGGVFRQMGQGTGVGITMAGVLLLILTPVMRVAVSILTFIYEHDRAFILITCFVLAVLIGSFFMGKA
jgi:uncharacterized membrane protein